MRYCNDIGMFAIDRPVSSCKWASDYCRTNCYNRKLYAMYPGMAAFEDTLASQWNELTGTMVNAELSRKRHQTERVRFMTRGESFANLDDIAKVEEICHANPDTLFWAPTRAWRNPDMIRELEALGCRCPNLRLMASTDPSTTVADWSRLKYRGWSTMFFGDDNKAKTGAGENFHKCAKTWNHDNGHCAECTDGCFLTTRVNVHLKEH